MWQLNVCARTALEVDAEEALQVVLRLVLHGGDPAGGINGWMCGWFACVEGLVRCQAKQDG